MYKQLLERVAKYFTGDAYLPEFQAAREEYFQRTGKVFEDEPMFERRITAFLEWYLLDRILWDVGIPPVRLFALMFGDSLTEAEQHPIRQMQTTRHSLFSYEGRSGGRCLLRDLLENRLHKVSEHGPLPGIRKGDILDARLIELEGALQFCEAMWVHPSEGKAFILEELKRRKDGPSWSPEEFLFDFAYVKLKRERYQHLPAREIYAKSSLPAARPGSET
jgi:hypothetical protein